MVSLVSTSVPVMSSSTPSMMPRSTSHTGVPVRGSRSVVRVRVSLTSTRSSSSSTSRSPSCICANQSLSPWMDVMPRSRLERLLARYSAGPALSPRISGRMENCSRRTRATGAVSSAREARSTSPASG